MSVVKVAVVCGIMAVLLSACGISNKPIAGASTSQLKHSHDYFGLVDHSYTKQLKCLRKVGKKGKAKQRFKVHLSLTPKDKLPVIQVGAAPAGPTIIFYPTPGIAQGRQIMGEEQGAEIIGSALLYPNDATAKLLSKVEKCTAAGVG